ncbi:hypothetical protein AKJ09_01911 [Labilithrix luteola]|uniref:Uncharacterized protein n=1 Tax=Labilithrix luteola TaxID=1391654 RepID=A0A0K1PP15_9BACT|nr:hypothetical protein [Labilithrix luteola]AKU95247.1 hypothetical protein AKJ09_01911 [Labilithrix luteola]
MANEHDDPTYGAPHAPDDPAGSAKRAPAIVARMVVSDPGAPVKETALVLSDALLAQLRIKGPIPR